FGRGDGQDVIIDDDATVGNLDKLVFKTGVAVADVLAVRDGDALILKINGTTDQVRIDSYFSNDGVNNRQIEEIRFTDSATTVWKLADIKARVLTGTAGNDYLVGYGATDDTFLAGAGDDRVYGRDGNDNLDGQDGDDAVYGEAGDDTVSGGNGNDSLYGGDGTDIINGGNGDDRLLGESGNDTLNGDAGNDVLPGGVGDDTLDGGAGNDILAGGVYDTWNGNYNGAGNDTY
ncbi:calcium-binding protein, partial [Paracidovorax avenae]|uniref:calcium-binding protein n=2 Tax=Paracidovorax avenae TaxID=80867 RepID=UPI000D20E69C